MPRGDDVVELAAEQVVSMGSGIAFRGHRKSQGFEGFRHVDDIGDTDQRSAAGQKFEIGVQQSRGEAIRQRTIRHDREIEIAGEHHAGQKGAVAFGHRNAHERVGL